MATQVGTYTWHASYSGDGLNNGAIDDGTNESVTTVHGQPGCQHQRQRDGGGVVGTPIERLGHRQRRLQRGRQHHVHADRPRQQHQHRRHGAGSAARTPTTRRR